MLRLLKYLKPYTLLILIAIALLFVQANADLALPDYLSKIVNNGIQQGGVENAVPEAVRKSEMDKLVLFMNTDEQKLVLGNYALVNQELSEYAALVERYPTLANEPIYILKEIDSAGIDQMNPVLGKAWLVVASINQIISDPTKAAGMGQALGIDLSNLPMGSDLFSILKNLPQSQISSITSAISQKFSTLGDSTINQMAVGSVKAEYAALGMDTGKIQTDYITNAGLLMLGVTLISVICTIIVSYLSAKTAAGLARDLRRNIFEKVESFSSTEIDKFSTASLITRSTNDITQIQMVVIMMMRMVIYAPIIGVGGVIRALSKTTSMWWIIALAVVVLLGLIVTVFSIALPKFKSIQNLIDRLNLVTRENLSGMMVIRAFNTQDFEEKRFDKANKDLTSTLLFINRVMVVMMPVMMFVMNAVMLTDYLGWSARGCPVPDASG